MSSNRRGPDSGDAPGGAGEPGSRQPAAGPIIEVESLYKSYRMGEVEVEVLKGIDLAVRSGEFLAVMGPSGSGKSTLLYLMGGLDRPTSGKVLVNGRDLSAMKNGEGSRLRRREVGFVFQFYNLVPNLSVEENVLLPVLLDGKRPAAWKGALADILEVVGLSQRRGHTPRELSGGEQQRVALARALINEPDIVLADEPTGNLDSKTGEEMLALMSRINAEQGKTIVMVTHSSEAASHSRRVVHVLDGRISE